MARILVTGGTGALGSAVAASLKTTDNRVRVLSRKPAPSALEPSLEWAQGDITTGEGLPAALANVEIVVNCTGDARNVYQTDVLGVQRLAEAAHQAGVKHFFHISIVGIDRINLTYYQHKLRAEAAVSGSGVPYSVLRVTQFHSLLHSILSRMEVVPEGYGLPIAHDALFQLIDTRDVAAHMLPLLLAQPAGRLPDVGGPQILSVEEIARTYLQGRGITDPVFVDLPEGYFPPAAVEGYQQGANTVPGNRYGHITWADYVGQQVQTGKEQPGS
jgi:uncharacterized protein YbjT (DUF2867 family)